MPKLLRIRKRKNLNLYLYREYRDNIPMYEESKACARTLAEKFNIDEILIDNLNDGSCLIYIFKDGKYVLQNLNPSKEELTVNEEKANKIIHSVIDGIRTVFLDSETIEQFSDYILNNYNAPRLYPNKKDLSDVEYMYQEIAEKAFLIIRDNFEACPTVHDFYEWLFDKIDISISVNE